MIHELKCFPEYFQDIIDGKKTFEIRLNDRCYQVGDLLALNEYLPDSDSYTGRSCVVLVDYILNDEMYCKTGFVIMGIKPIPIGEKRVGMKFNVEKFISDTNNSDYYHKWNDNLKQMNDMIGYPTYSNSKHYWTFYLDKYMNQPIDIGFDDNGNIFCEYSNKEHIAKNKKTITASQANTMAETFLKVLNVFDEFGFIIHSTVKNGAE